MSNREEMKESLDSLSAFVFMYQSMFFNEFHSGSNELISVYFCGHHVMYRHTMGLNYPEVEDVMLYNDFMDWIVRTSKKIAEGN